MIFTYFILNYLRIKLEVDHNHILLIAAQLRLLNYISDHVFSLLKGTAYPIAELRKRPPRVPNDYLRTAK